MKLYTIGQVVGARGIKGEIKIYPHTSFPERFAQMSKVLIGKEESEESLEKYVIEVQRVHKDMIILKLLGIDTRNDAEGLVGKKLFVTREELYQLPEDHYYIFDLIGLKVEDKKWGLLGNIKEVIEGAQDLFVVTPSSDSPAKTEFMIPAVKDLVLSIDLIKGVAVVDLPEGLWEE